MLPAPDRLWRHPAERGAEQAAANLAARRVYGRRWPSMVMSFIAGCTVVGTAWLLQGEPQPQVAAEPKFFEVPASSTSIAFDGGLALNEWPDEVAQLNQTSVVALRIDGEAPHGRAQAILIANDGYLITSAHSLIGADTSGLQAELATGKTLPATLVASDAVSGVAVLKINSPELPTPWFGDENKVLPGDQLVGLARGASGPSARLVGLLGKDQTTTLPNDDLLSGLLRLSDDLDDSWAGAAILDDDGGIVGMAVESRAGGHYAIPTSLARQVAQELIDTGAVDHKAWLGVDLGVSGLTDSIKAERQLLGGVLIQRVWDETPAARAGLVAGDIIVGAGTVNVLDRTDLRLVMATLDPGDSIEVRYSRSVPTTVGSDETTPEPGELPGQIFTTTVVVGAAPNA